MEKNAEQFNRSESSNSVDPHVNNWRRGDKMCERTSRNAKKEEVPRNPDKSETKYGGQKQKGAHRHENHHLV